MLSALLLVILRYEFLNLVILAKIIYSAGDVDFPQLGLAR